MPLHCSCYGVVYPCLLYYLWACGLKCLSCQFHMLFLPLVYNTQYSCWVSPYNILGFLGPFYSLGILSPFHSLGASLAHFILSYFLHSHGLLLNLLGFPAQLPHPLPLGLLAFEPISFTNSFLWALLVRFLFLSISYDSHGLATSIFGAPLGSFAFFRAFLLFCRHVDNYSNHSSPMIFILLFHFFISFILLGFFCHWALLPKIGINND